MLRRLNAKLSADDEGNTSAAPSVSEGYGKARQAKFGVSPEGVYVATGQLAGDLSDVGGFIALTRGIGNRRS
jgi:hypothetical protein